MATTTMAGSNGMTSMSTTLTPTTMWAMLSRQEDAARERAFAEIGAHARYLCVRCRQAYTLHCLNPACKRTVHRPAHVMPREIADAMVAARRAERDAQRQGIRDMVETVLWPAVADAFRAWRMAHPARKFAIAEIPFVEERRDGVYWQHAPTGPNLPPELAVRWDTVRIRVADGTYEPYRGTRLDISRTDVMEIGTLT